MAKMRVPFTEARSSKYNLIFRLNLESALRSRSVCLSADRVTCLLTNIKGLPLCISAATDANQTRHLIVRLWLCAVIKSEGYNMYFLLTSCLEYQLAVCQQPTTSLSLKLSNSFPPHLLVARQQSVRLSSILDYHHHRRLRHG